MTHGRGAGGDTRREWERQNAGAAPRCTVEPRVPQPLTPWGRVPRAARTSGAEPGSVPHGGVTRHRERRSPALRMARAAQGPRCDVTLASLQHPQAALSQPALQTQPRTVSHGRVSDSPEPAGAEMPLSAALRPVFGPSRGAARPYGGGPGGLGPGRENSGGQHGGGIPEGRAGAGRGLWQSRGAATEPTQSCPQTCVHILAHTCAPLTRPLPSPPEKGSAQPPLRDAEPDLEQHGDACGPQAGNGCPHCSTPAQPCPLRSPVSSRAPRVSQRTLLHPPPPRRRPAPPHPAPFPSRSATSGGRPWAAFVPPAAPGPSPRGSGALISASPLGSGVPAGLSGPSGSLREGPTPSQRVPEPQRISSRSVCPPGPGTPPPPPPPPPGALRAASDRQHPAGAGLRGSPDGSLPCSG